MTIQSRSLTPVRLKSEVRMRLDTISDLIESIRLCNDEKRTKPFKAGISLAMDQLSQLLADPCEGEPVDRVVRYLCTITIDPNEDECDMNFTLDPFCMFTIRVAMERKGSRLLTEFVRATQRAALPKGVDSLRRLYE